MGAVCAATQVIRSRGYQRIEGDFRGIGTGEGAGSLAQPSNTARMASDGATIPSFDLLFAPKLDPPPRLYPADRDNRVKGISASAQHFAAAPDARGWAEATVPPVKRAGKLGEAHDGMSPMTRDGRKHHRRMSNSETSLGSRGLRPQRSGFVIPSLPYGTRRRW